ncbi:MAG: YhbY family RNA-binding protein [Nanoarchaeota archaeon]|nr:YhbY family RNA-binding protein [Nanoarchaeota archaeon]
MRTIDTSTLKKAIALEPMLQVGKKGITKELIAELTKLLNKHKMVKVKLLRSFVSSNSKKEAAERLADSTKSRIVSQTGFTVVLIKGYQ